MDATSPAKRYVSYDRVSTDEQALSGAGLNVQRSAIERAFEYEGWVRVKSCHDEGASAATLDRPGLLEALQLIADGEADGIVVAKLDRLTRSIVDFGELLEWLDQAGAALVALDMRLDTSTPTGAMVAQMLIVVAEWERKTIAERTRNALGAKRDAGEAIGRPSVADEPELADRVRAMSESMSLRGIADALNEEGIPTMRGGAKWRASSVQTILGYRRPASRRKKTKLPPLPPRRRAA